MSVGRVMDLTVVCHSFPEMPIHRIDRDNLLNLFIKTFSGDTELLVVEGDEGIGKTILLAQFATKHPLQVFSLFIKSTSRWAYDPESLRFDLCNQIHWLLHGTELDTNEGVDDTFLRRSWSSLKRYSIQSRKTLFFIVDGLDEIPEEESQTRKIIIDMLPFGYPTFRFLLSGEPNKILQNVNQKIRHKTHILAGFTLEETIEYLKDLPFDKDIIRELYNLCGGNAGYLDTIRRMLESDFDVHTLLDEMPDELPRLFEVEWQRANIDDTKQKQLLAFIAFARKGSSLSDLSRILDLEEATIRGLIQNLKFIIINQQTYEVTFVSEAFRKFVSAKLQYLKDEVYDLVINDLLKQPEGDDALVYLPSYLDKTERFGDLVNYLTLDHCTKMIERSQSLVPVEQKTELGVKAARQLREDGDLMRFGVQGSLLSEIDGSEVWKSEIEAKIALNDYDSALTLAQSNVLKEDRLHLLSIVAKTQREQGLSVSDDLITQIRQLYDQIDRTTLGQRAIEIAADLIYPAPDLAIKLVEESTKTEASENALDWAFARLSAVTLGVNRKRFRTVDAVENIHLRIKDPKAMRFSTTATLLQEEYSATEVLEITEKFDNVGDRLYMLRHWAVENRNRTDAIDVVEFALDLIIKTTAYAPNAKVIREIASPLPFIQDKEKIKQLVASFDSQRGTVERFGPTQDYVRLQLLLAQAEANYDMENASIRVIDIYFYIAHLDDLAVKSECLAWLVSSITNMDPDMFFEKKEGMHTLAQAELLQNVDQLLSTTADHYQVTEGIVEALAESKPDMALKITRLLNIEFRCDNSLLDLIKKMILSSGHKINLSFVQKALEDLVDPDLRGEVVVNVVAHLSNLNENLETFIPGALPIIDRIKDIRDPGQRCLACCFAYVFLMKQNTDQYSGLSANLLRQLEKAWSNIDVEWHKIDMGFKITKHLATSSIDEARRYLQLTEKLRDEVMLDAKTVALAYMYCIRLAIRVYSGLLPKSIGNFYEDLQHLARLINNIVSYGERAKLWAELALRCYINKRGDAGNDIVRDYIKPLLQNISEEDKVYRNEVFMTIAPALYYEHKKIAIEQIQQLSQDERNQACEQICKFILHKQLPSDPYDALPAQGYDIQFEEIVDICEVLDLTDCDQDIYHFISCVSDAITSRRFKDRFSAQQKADIALRFGKIVDNKLPSARFIRHAGFKIAAKAQIARFGQGTSQVWNDLVDEARQIPNIADQAFVLAMIAEAMPSKVAEKRKSFLVEAQELIKKIPAIFDRIEHYEALASIAIKIELTMYKDLLKLAMVAASGTQSSERYTVQRRLVDIAYEVDTEFAASLASIADDDPARKKLKERLQVLNLKKEVANQFKTDEHLPKEASSQDYAQVAWMLLGTLNAGTTAAKNMSQLRDFIQVASGLPFSKSYQLFAWIIENITKNYAKTEQARDFIGPIYKSLLLNIELIRRMAGRSLKQLKQTQRQLAESVDHDNIVIHPGERDKAIQFIRDWFINSVHEYLKICDEYFGPDDLDILLLLRSVKPDCKVQILTSKQHQDTEKVGMPNKWEEAYGAYWRLHVSSVQDPPDTEITVVGTITHGVSPVHDRWWLTEGSGISVGTSLNGLGNSLSNISILSPEVAATREGEVDNYLQWLVREHKGEKLQRWVFPLH